MFEVKRGGFYKQQVGVGKSSALILYNMAMHKQISRGQGMSTKKLLRNLGDRFLPNQPKDVRLEALELEMSSLAQLGAVAGLYES